MAAAPAIGSSALMPVGYVHAVLQQQSARPLITRRRARVAQSLGPAARAMRLASSTRTRSMTSRPTSLVEPPESRTPLRSPPF